jgi:hypothetical protein
LEPNKMTAKNNEPLTMCSVYESSLLTSTSMFFSNKRRTMNKKKVLKYIQEDM